MRYIRYKGASTRHLDKVDPADEEGDQAGEDGGEDVEEDQGEQVDRCLAEVLNFLPLEIVTFYITWGSNRLIFNIKTISRNFTEVDSIWSIIDNDKTCKVGKRDDDSNALADHQDLRILPKLSFVLT